jgi:hypothetical protein
VIALAVLRLTLRADLGVEWDSNANRAEVIRDDPMMMTPADQVDQPTPSFLLRTMLRGTLAWRRGKNALGAMAGAAGKVFFEPDVSDQDTIVGQVSLEDRFRARDWLELGGSLDYYDAAQLNVLPKCAQMPPGCGSRHRDFRSGTSLARLALIGPPGVLSVAGGYRGFQYKPDPNFDFQGGVAHVSATGRWRFGDEGKESELDVVGTAHMERRFFQGARAVDTCVGQELGVGCVSTLDTGPRADWFYEESVELTWVRWFLLSAGYAFQANLSNSFGQSLFRHVVSAKVAFRVPWELYFTIKGQLYIAHYLDRILLSRSVNTQTFVTIEDENRNALLVDIERPIARLGLAVSARYSFYTNELGATPVSFLRHVVYLGLSYQYGLTR